MLIVRICTFWAIKPKEETIYDLKKKKLNFRDSYHSFFEEITPRSKISCLGTFKSPQTVTCRISWSRHEFQPRWVEANNRRLQIESVEANSQLLPGSAEANIRPTPLNATAFVSKLVKAEISCKSHQYLKPAQFVANKSESLHQN